MENNKTIIDGFMVIKEFLLTKGENIVNSKGMIPFKPLIDFGLIIYSQKANATNRLAMKFDLERFFMRQSAAEMSGTDVRCVRVPKSIIAKVTEINNQFRSGTLTEE